MEWRLQGPGSLVPSSIFSNPSVFDWWSGVWIPIIFGILSIGAGLAALAVAIAANTHARAANTTAQAALDLTARIAEKEAEERHEDRQRALRAKRARIVDQARDALKRANLRTMPPQDESDVFSRALEVAAAVRDGCIREGLPQSAGHPLVPWILGAFDEVGKRIHVESGSGDPSGRRTWERRGWRVLDSTVHFQLNRWRESGLVDATLTVEGMMNRVYFPEEKRRLQRLRESLRPATDSET